MAKPVFGPHERRGAALFSRWPGDGGHRTKQLFLAKPSAERLEATAPTRLWAWHNTQPIGAQLSSSGKHRLPMVARVGLSGRAVVATIVRCRCLWSKRNERSPCGTSGGLSGRPPWAGMSRPCTGARDCSRRSTSDLWPRPDTLIQQVENASQSRHLPASATIRRQRHGEHGISA